MREILFRGKRVENDEWVFGDLIHEPWASCIQVIEKDNINTFKRTKYSVHKETVGQYTGLTDKNGNKIYEGDILELDGEEVFFEVGYETNAAKFVIIGDIDMFYFDNVWTSEIKIVGNIHDDPELVGGSEE